MLSSTNNREFRADIEGLRAVAVLAVLLFHLGVTGIRGGFVGVDVFFVISGYLITRNIHVDVLKSVFSVSNFYFRRARRLLPALFATLFVTLFAGALVLSPAHYERLARAIAAATLSVSNIMYYTEDGYFDASSNFKPDLHTWSLGVEIQFYLVWPWLLVWLLKAERKIWPILTIAGLSLLSVAGASLLLGVKPAASFYLMPFRFFEFAIGAGAYALSRRIVLPGAICEASLAAGLVFITISCLAYSEDMKFPGYVALFPCLGAALVIWGGQARFGGVLLRNAVANFFGQISYSLYLVHWPIIIFYKYLTFRPLTPLAQFFLFVVSVGMATLLWKFVEVPGRRGTLLKQLSTIKPMAQTVACVSALLIALCAGVSLSKGFPARLNDQELSFARAARDRPGPECKTIKGADAYRGCAFGATATGPFDIALLGDSHAQALRPGFAAAFSDRGWSAVSIGNPGCAPLKGALLYADNLPAFSCTQLYDQGFAALNHLKPKIVVIAARWGVYTNTRRDGLETGPRRFVTYGPFTEHTAESSTRALAASLDTTVHELVGAGFKVVLIGQVPTVGLDPVTCLGRPSFLNLSGAMRDCHFFSANAARMRLAASISILTQIAGKYPGQVFLYLPSDDMCDQSNCEISHENTTLFYDANHLSTSGAKYVVKRYFGGVMDFIETAMHDQSAAIAPQNR